MSEGPACDELHQPTGRTSSADLKGSFPSQTTRSIGANARLTPKRERSRLARKKDTLASECVKLKVDLQTHSNWVRPAWAKRSRRVMLREPPIEGRPGPSQFDPIQPRPLA